MRGTSRPGKLGAPNRRFVRVATGGAIPRKTLGHPVGIGEDSGLESGLGDFRQPLSVKSAFLLSFALGVSSILLAPAISHAAEPARPFGSNVQWRGSLNNSRLQFEQGKKGRVAFIGGSITEMNGYRPMVCEALKQRFPQTEFTFVDAGISSTCSTTGA